MGPPERRGDRLPHQPGTLQARGRAPARVGLPMPASRWRRLLRKYRHASEIDCVPRAQVEAFKARHGITSEGHAKALMYIESFHPREEGER